jgi:hypothetical protein
MRDSIKAATHKEAFGKIPIDGAQQASGQPGRDTFLTDRPPNRVGKFQLN